MNMINTLEQALKEIQDLKDKLNKYEKQNKNFKSFLNKYKINNEKELKDFIIKYYEHKCERSHTTIEESFQYKQLKKQNEELFRKLNMKENTIDVEKERLKTELESLKKKQDDKEQELYDNIREEVNNEYKDEIERIKDEKDNISINYNDKIKKIEEFYKKEIENLKIDNENKLNKKEKPLPSPSTSSESNKSRHIGKDLKNINEFFDKNRYHKVIVLDNAKTNARIKIGKRTYEFLTFYNDLYNIASSESNSEFDSLTDCAKYVLNAKNIEPTSDNIYNWKKIINRSNELLKDFKKEELFNIYYNINNIKYINAKNWPKWKEYLREKIQDRHIGKVSKKVNINNFDNRKYKKFMILSFILKNKDLIKNKLNNNVSISFEPQKAINIDKTRKYIPKTLKKNETKIINVKEWYKYINWSNYKIGTTIIAEKRGFDKKAIIIGNFCKKCRNPFNDKGDICYPCEKEEYSYKHGFADRTGIPASIESDYNRCDNCCNLFKYNNKNDEYCDDCIINNN